MNGLKAYGWIEDIKAYSKDFVHCLLYVLEIFDDVEAVSKLFQNAKTCQQIYGVIIPMLIKYIADSDEDMKDNKKLKNIILQYVADNLADVNNNLLETIKSLPRTVVAYVQQQLNSVQAKTKKKKKTTDDGDS